MEVLKVQAKKLSEDFLAHEKEYMLGFIEAEQPNPLTRNLSEDYDESTNKGISTLIKADNAIIDVYRNIIYSQKFDDFCGKVYNSILKDGRIIVSGCGATGRLFFYE